MDIFTVLSLIGGLALFLYGMDLMGDGLKKLAGGKLESFLAKLTSARWKGLLLGLGVTAVIQSSSATTVMLVGFVNSGIMKLSQTISIIMGANIGTTITAWLLTTTDIPDGAGFLLNLFKPSSFTPILAIIGLIMMMTAKNDRRRNTGSILIGFAILMFGMDAMSSAVSNLRNAFNSMLVMFKNPIVGILVGTIFTAIIQSSSASVGVLIALAASGVNMPFSIALPLLLGMNIGTTITPIISAISGNIHAKRVAFACLYIKMIGVAVVTSAFYAIHSFVGFEFMATPANVVGIAFAHTLFNVISTIILIPFCNLIEKLTIVTIKGKQDEEDNIFATLDDRFLDVPSFAVEKCKDLVSEMATIAADSYKKATELMENFVEEEFDKISRLEKMVDKYEDKTSTYLVKIAATQMSAKDSKVVTELLHCIGDIERISDHALNIAEAVKEIHEKKITFSDKAKRDLAIITAAVGETLDLAVRALVNDDIEIAKLVEPLEQVIDRLKRKIKNGHISRLRQGDCTVELGFILSDLLTNYERISDHCSNIAVCFIEIANDSFETHEYLSQVKSGGAEYNKMYEAYKKKYYID
ncbi:MAG: Na/Pi cotransporter family protein [Ruminococcaceae bacterium]|nr:Na/Pi cotransporter family protein [Oscillospiraceae bacterium]